MPNETDPSLRSEMGYRPELQAIIDQLRVDPTTAFYCRHGHPEPAIAIYEVPRGCVALPGVEVQPLCQHHRWSDGSFEGMIPIVDLSVDAEWSKRREEEPDYCITSNPKTGELKLVSFAGRFSIQP